MSILIQESSRLPMIVRYDDGSLIPLHEYEYGLHMNGSCMSEPEFYIAIIEFCSLYGFDYEKAKADFVARHYPDPEALKFVIEKYGSIEDSDWGFLEYVASLGMETIYEQSKAWNFANPDGRRSWWHVIGRGLYKHTRQPAMNQRVYWHFNEITFVPHLLPYLGPTLRFPKGSEFSVEEGVEVQEGELVLAVSPSSHPGWPYLETVAVAGRQGQQRKRGPMRPRATFDGGLYNPKWQIAGRIHRASFQIGDSPTISISRKGGGLLPSDFDTFSEYLSCPPFSR